MENETASSKKSVIMGAVKKPAVWVLVLLTFLQITIYAPNVGRGFIRDDFIWLDNVIREGQIDYIRPFTKTTGFFRPLVSFTFGIQYQLHGLRPEPFGLFNLILHILNVILVFLLLSCRKESKPYAIWTAVLFALNGKAASMAVGWVSGRTTLLFSFFMLLSFYTYLRLPRKGVIRPVLTGIFYLAALFSKETAAAAPIFVFLYAFFKNGRDAKERAFFHKVKAAATTTSIFILPLVIYLFFRFRSDAMTPISAPEFYRYNFSPLLLIENFIEYVIRAGLLDVYIILLLSILLMISFWITKRSREKVQAEQHLDRRGLLWGSLCFVCFILPELFIPARSSLYSYFPQIGIHLAALTVITFLWAKLPETKKPIRPAALTLICLLSIGWLGFLWDMSSSAKLQGEASRRFTAQITQATSELPPGTKVFVVDSQFGKDSSPSRIISYGFHPLLNLYHPHKHFSGEIIPTEKIADKHGDPLSVFFKWENGLLRPFFPDLKRIIYRRLVLNRITTG
jgi:hypothetical protein